MSMRFLILSFLIGTTFLYVYAHAQPSNTEGLFSADAPIEIKAQTLKSDQKAGVTVFEGSVVATQADTTLKADRMEVHTDDKGTITKIIAMGNVMLKKQNQTITAEQAEYIHQDETIIFTGNPVARSEDTTVMGTKIIYHTSDGSTTVENSRVIIKKTKKGSSGGTP